MPSLSTGKTDGFFGNEAIKILLPEKIRSLEKGLRSAGLGRRVDDFELSMNRGAEKTAPEAKGIFLGAIREMTLEDGRKILTGGRDSRYRLLQNEDRRELDRRLPSDRRKSHEGD